MSADASFEASEKDRPAGSGVGVNPALKENMRAGWRSPWTTEKSLRDRGYVCAKCSYFKLEASHPLSKTFPDLGICERTGYHRFGSASCNAGRWQGRSRPDV